AATAQEETAAQRELVRRFPDHELYALELGVLLVDRNMHDQAKEVLEPLTRTGTPSHSGQAHFHLARDCYRRDDLEQALKHMEAGVKEDPDILNTVRGNVLRGVILEELKRPEEAAQAFQLALT